MWNLKNANKINNFSEVQSIDFSNTDGFWAVITTNDEEYVFDLSKTYDPIPDDLKDRKMEVDPEDHDINVSINEIDITPYVEGKGGTPTEVDIKEDEVEEEDPAEKVEELEHVDAEEPEKKEAVEELEDKILSKLEKSGALLNNDKED